MSPVPHPIIDRRSFLTAAAGLAKTTVAGSLLGAPALLSRRAQAAPHTREPLLSPPEIRSENGLLNATLAAAPGRVALGEFAFPGLLYNGTYMPPLLRPKLGDTMRIKFRNQLPDDPSNLHYHGLSVSPQGNSDNVFIHVHPGQEFDYEVHIPAQDRQGPGFFCTIRTPMAWSPSR